MSTSLGAIVFGYIFPSNRVGMEEALTRLTEEHFTDKTQAIFFKILKTYGEKYGDIFNGTYLVDLLRRNQVQDSKSILLQETYDSYCRAEVQEHDFRYAIDGLIDDLNQLKSGRIITTGYEIMERGVEVEGEFLQGYKAANDFILSTLGNFDQDISEEAPEGDIRQDAEEILEEYNNSKNSETTSGIQFGISSLDEVTSGLQPGELGIIAAFTNHGKSHFSAQTSWHAAVIQGKATYLATTETVRNTTRRRILARHSMLPQFGLPGGLDAHSIKNGTLTPDQEAIYHDVIKDLTTNSNYAPLHIAQMPRNVTVTYLENSLNRVNRKGIPYEFLAVDYLQLWSSIRKRGSEREEYNEILKDAKKFATTFDKGRGIPFLTPWQMSRDAFDKAKSGSYSSSSLSDTSEAEKTADIIISLLRADSYSDEAILQILKARDAPLMGPTNVYLDYRCSYIGDTASEAPSVSTDLTGGFNMYSLLGT